MLAGQGNVTTGITNMLISKPRDVFAPWSMKRRPADPERRRDPGTRWGCSKASRAFGPPRDGLRLPDIDFWWTVASCRNGVWGFQAYHYPTDGFANVKFVGEALLVGQRCRSRSIRPASWSRPNCAAT